MRVVVFVHGKIQNVLWAYYSFPTLLHCLLCYLSLSLLQGCSVLQLFHTCGLRPSDIFRVMLQSNCARSLVVNLHSKLEVGGIGEFFSIGKNTNQKDPLCCNANICNGIISQVGQLGVELGGGGMI